MCTLKWFLLHAIFASNGGHQILSTFDTEVTFDCVYKDYGAAAQAREKTIQTTEIMTIIIYVHLYYICCNKLSNLIYTKLYLFHDQVGIKLIIKGNKCDTLFLFSQVPCNIETAKCPSAIHA